MKRRFWREGESGNGGYERWKEWILSWFLIVFTFVIFGLCFEEILMFGGLFVSLFFWEFFGFFSLVALRWFI